MRETARLGVVLLDPMGTHIVAPSAAHTSSPATPARTTTTTRSSTGPISADAEPEEDGSDQDSSDSAPGKTEGPDAEARVAADGRERGAHLNEGGGHERRGEGEEEEGTRRHEGRERGAEAAKAGEEAREEGHDGEQQREQVEDPAEAPHVEVRETRGAAPVRPDQFCRQVRAGGIPRPGPADGGVGPGVAAARVVGAADAKVGPARQGARTGDAGGIGGEEVRLSEGGCAHGAGEDDEEEEHDGAGEKEEGERSEGGSWGGPG